MAEMKRLPQLVARPGGREESDFAHVRRFKSTGDPEAFEALFRRHQQHIADLCLAILRSRADAEDATQEVFLKAYKAIRSFEPTVTLRGWLHRIAVNHCCDVLERRKRLAEEPESAHLSTLASRGRGECDVIETMAIEASLCRLDTHYRIAFVLSAVQGYTIAEVAELSGIGVEAAASRIRRAYKQFVDAYTSLTRRQSC